MDADDKQKPMQFFASYSILCALLALALFYSNEMALTLFGVMAYLFGLFSPLFWFLFNNGALDEKKRPNVANVSR